MGGIALVIPPAGPLRQVDWPSDSDAQMALLYAEGNYRSAQLVWPRRDEPGIVLWVDEEGAVHGEPFNIRASLLAHPGYGDLVGTAIVTFAPGTDGSKIDGLTPPVIEHVEGWLRDVIDPG